MKSPAHDGREIFFAPTKGGISLRKHNGSALVWIICACIVCVFLAMTMMAPCCSDGCEYSAKASNIVHDLRNLKTAVLAWYADNLDSFDKEYTIAGKTAEELADTPEYSRVITAYFTSNNKIPTLRGKSAASGEYILACGNNSREWFIGYNLDGEDERVRRKLSGRSKAVGLLNYPGADAPYYKPESLRVWMKIL